VADLSEFAKTPRHKMSHPTGWEPGVTWNPSKGGTITAQLDGEPDQSIWEMLIADWGLNPERTEVVDGSLQIRAWDAPDPEGGLRRLFYYRATIKPRDAMTDRADIEALCDRVMKFKAKPVIKSDNAGVYFHAMSDYQLGKGEGGGTPATVERILRALERSLSRAKDLRKRGLIGSRVVLAGLGDIVEGCGNDWYSTGSWTQDATQREQDKIARRLILAHVDAFVDAGFEVVLVTVPGNHGENRANGKILTDFTDNRDVAVFETVGEILNANPARYGNVRLALDTLNSDDLTATLDIGGLPVTLAHGHQFRNGANAAAKMEGWLKGQVLGRQAAGDCEILIAAHGHHFAMSESTGRTVIQAPTMDGGSQWWTSTTGQESPAGVLTLIIGLSVGPRGWGELQIL